MARNAKYFVSLCYLFYLHLVYIIAILFSRYNNVQIRTRIIVERTFGIWKRRFPCLSRGLSNKLVCSTTIVMACAVLHNISRIIDEAEPEPENGYNFIEDDIPVDAPHQQPGDGLAARAALVERLFDVPNHHQ